MTLAERWMNKGRRQEIIENIELIMSCQFDKQTRMLLPHVRKIEDLGKLKEIIKAAMTEKDASKLKRIIIQ